MTSYKLDVIKHFGGPNMKVNVNKNWFTVKIICHIWGEKSKCKWKLVYKKRILFYDDEHTCHIRGEWSGLEFPHPWVGPRFVSCNDAVAYTLPV